MKNTIFAALAAVALAAPAAATEKFTGVRVEATVGADSVINGVDRTDVKYGAAAGFDIKVLPRVTAGLEASVANVFDRADIGVAARLGYTVTNNVLVYGRAGYSNFRQLPGLELEGLQVGGGVEVAVVGPVYAGLEYRYTDFSGRVGQHGGLARVGLRF